MKPNREKKIDEISKKRQEGILVLEDIHDPHNAAAAFRNCDAFGIQKVFLVFVNEKGFDPERMGKRSSSSANKWLDFKIFRSTTECYQELKKMNYISIATSLADKKNTLWKTNFEIPKIAVWFGNEHRGLSDEAIKNADQTLYIPMRGMVQSFNLSVSTAIVLSELTRQRDDRKEFRLGKEEVSELTKRWRWNRK